MFNRQLAKSRAKGILHRNMIFLGALAAIPIIFNFLGNRIGPEITFNIPAATETLTQAQVDSMMDALTASALISIPYTILLSLVVAFLSYFTMVAAGYLTKNPESDSVPISNIVSLGGFIKYVLKVFVKNLLIGLGLILFVIPGIYLSYRFYLVEQIAVDRPDFGIGETLSEAGLLSKGSKFDFFVLDLSFILWNILSVFTFGISDLYVQPYILLTHFDVYEQLKERLYPDEELHNEFVNSVEF
ncbi:hypothetical protein A4S06_04065 [Erysipelotrichaceae bacterium MTC7]|nr:hypothetical protein A4S06_04065 [Erysipelotrichaceae bacterium MTC7]